MKINVELPVDLKYILCRDWDNIVNKKRLFTIPAKVLYHLFMIHDQLDSIIQGWGGGYICPGEI